MEIVIKLPKQLTYASANDILRSLPVANAPRIIFDFSTLDFSNPLGMLMLGSGLRKFAKRRQQEGLSTAASGLSSAKAAHSYLDHLGFFDFINLPNRTPLGTAKGNMRYIPIKRISWTTLSVAPGDSKGLHEALIEEGELLASVLAGCDLSEYEVKRGLGYGIREIVRNVFEHSGANECYVAGQRWQDDTVEIVIMDEGVGILKTLSESFDLMSDQDALSSAIKPGVSRTSNLPEALNRNGNSGFGLYVLSQIGRRFGQFVLGSGTAALRQQKGNHLQIDATNFTGTFVGIRLDRRPPNFRVLLEEIVAKGEAEATMAGVRVRASSSSRMS